MRILLTGSEGFIGYHVDGYLTERGHEVRGLDITTHGRKAITEVRGDVRALSSVCDAAKGCDAIVHLAAKTGVADSMEWPGQYICTNIEGTENVFRAAKECGIKKVVYASSSSVYGDRGGNKPTREDEAGRGLKSIYAVTKFAQEHVAQVYAGMGMEAIGLRFFSVYGPCGRPDNVVTRTMAAAKDAMLVLPIYAHGRQRRDFTYVGDVVDAIVKAVELDVQGWSGVLNVGAGVPVCVADVVAMVENQMKTGLDGVRKEYRDARDCDIEATWADIEEAGRVLEWRPEVDVEEGIRRTIEAENLSSGT